jgi:uncharacterized protein
MNQEIWNVIVWSSAILCIVIGFVGTIVPILPGTMMIFAGISLVAWWSDFVIIGVPVLVLTGILVIVSLVVDFLASVVGAKRVGASSLALWGATLGSFVGMFFMIPGIILGPFVGAFVGEYLAQSNASQATRAGLGTWLGLLVGTVLKVGISMAMIGIFIFGLIV